MNKRNLLSLTLSLIALSVFGWGQKGHDVCAYVAEQHLTEATRAAVDSLLNGRSMVYWANWLDNASHTPEYAYTKTWHYKNVNAGERYENAWANPAGDAVTAVKQQIELLSNPNAPLENKELALKILVHVVGDMHQPMHMGHGSDLGGNRWKVKFFDRDTNLHSIWDSNLVESAHKWSYTEWQQQIDRVSDASRHKITAGTVDDWAKQTMAITEAVYGATPVGSKVSYNEIARWAPVIEQQLLRGGLRLAHTLNCIFDADYASSNAAPYTPAE